MSAPFDPVQLAFEKTMREFRAALNNDELYDEILQTRTIDEVYDVTDKLQEEQAKNGKLRNLCKIEPYLEGLRGYASVIEVFMQVKPSVLALIWGPIKLLLQWASTLKQSFDAIVNTTARIGELLPEFQKATHLFSQNAVVKDVLQLFFKDILDFYLISLKFFSLPRWKYLFESVWPKHRGKIEVVTTHIERHIRLLRNEVRLEHIQAEHEFMTKSFKVYAITERSAQRQEYQNIITDISPRTYEDRLDWLNARRCDGTGRWLARDQVFSKWRDSTDASTKALWLQGIPGSGKTFLSSMVANEIERSGHVLFVFLSYNFRDDASALSIIHSLLFQLTSHNEELQTMVCQSARGSLKRSIDAVTGLMSTLLLAAGPTYIIIDGLDEIDLIERSRLLKQLLRLTKDCDRTKLLISSRPEADITDILKEGSKVIRVDNRNAGNIQTFVTQETQRWFQERMFLPAAQAEIECMLAPLSSKSKGMFLYAKVVLSSIRHLEFNDIRNDIEVLPESLDDAYGRVFARINMKPPMLKEKARKLLGWIGSSPVPLTIYEMEQALTVNPEDIEGKASVVSKLNVVEICGPIVEVVEDYVQFVHFTVQEYFFSPQIPDSIHPCIAALSLAMCCLTYLCQDHHDPEIEDESITANILSGKYRLHDFAATMWLELTEKVTSLSKLEDIPEDLVNLLQTFLSERTSGPYNDTTNGDASLPGFESFKKRWPGLHSVLCKSVNFRQLCSKSEYRQDQETQYTNLDPLTISDTGARIYGEFQALYKKPKAYKEDYQARIEWHYGKRPFKCGFLNCASRRHGFETISLRNSHMKCHNRPWKCTHPGCEFQEGGFLSRKMRDEHLDHFHQEKSTADISAIEKPEVDEIQPLLFDLVKADNVNGVKSLLEEFQNLKPTYKKELRGYAARFGSASMIDLIAPFSYIDDEYGLLKEALGQMNLETFRHLLSRNKKPTMQESNWRSFAIIGRNFSVFDRKEIFDEWEACVEFEFEVWKPQSFDAVAYVAPGIINATAGQVYKEQLLVMIWEKHVWKSLSMAGKSKALVNIAKTTCSVHLAKWLIDRGADIDHRMRGQGPTPLRYAARKTTAAAAEFMKLLLFHGADPEANSSRARLPIRQEKGALGISKWLGVSWDELVTQSKERLENGKLKMEE